MATYAFATTGNGVNVQVATSPDFVSWERLSGTDALPGPFPKIVFHAFENGQNIDNGRAMFVANISCSNKVIRVF